MELGQIEEGVTNEGNELNSLSYMPSLVLEQFLISINIYTGWTQSCQYQKGG